MRSISFLILMFLAINSFAQEEANLDYLLGEYTQKSDLSKNTKLSNAGHSIIFTRDDIEKMQARNLKDIVKTLPFFTYQESRYGIPNLYNIGDTVPFSSSPIRIYIDDHEMMSGAYGSSFALLGNVELEFVDHIEVYYYTPSFEYSVESTYLLIKLHTKVPQRDKGGKVLLSGGSYGGNQESTFYTDTLNNISYLAYLSNNNDKRDNPLISNKKVSKNTIRKHFLGTIFNDTNHLLVDAQYTDINPLSNMSVDGSSMNSNVGYDNLQISYINKSFDNIKLKASYQRGTTDINFADDNFLFCESYTPYPTGCIKKFSSTYLEEVGSAEANYGIKTGSNSFFMGINSRIKNVDVQKLKYDDSINIPKPDYNKQSVNSVFVQNEYLLTENSVITAGAKYSTIDNNGGVDNQNLNLYRIGYVYNKNDFVGKIFYYHTPNLLEPYLYSSWFNKNNLSLKPEVADVIHSQVEYTYEKNYFSLIYGQNRQENLIYFNPFYAYGPSIDNYNDTFKINFINFDYKYNFNSLNSVSFNTFTNFVKNAPFVGEFEQYGGFIRFLNTINKFDIFNEVTYRKDSLVKENFFDYSAGVKYKYSNNLSLSVKGENLLDKGTTQKIYTLDLNRIQTGETTNIDRKIYFTMEYMF